MKVAIVDDEMHCIESLVLDLQSIDKNIELVYKNNKPEEALDQLANLELDLLFLDVEMPGMNGFEFLEQMGTIPYDVIFTTAHSQYAVKAFKYHAFSYLMKPIDDKELAEVIHQWEKGKVKSNDQVNNIKSLLTQMKSEGILKSKIALPVYDGYEFLEVDDITYCQSDNNYATFYLKDGSKMLISKTLKEVEKILEKHMFLRIHQSFLINPKYLKKYQRTDGGYVIMEDGTSIRVSNQKKELIIGFFEAVKRSE
ncbi:hypothetical protein P872_20410 [Rhodonellum psychrophilum GCM71 = DSM 17998]|uniref:Uncharacterized protein n=2 Tax=Rhodonellum TaxID=336827 RepID=U5BZ59_9BACT|nr:MULTISPECIES: LytTR family DNA-binding domain-containing protein [Rhodonellum]ERM81202.1 hypothetical protein P872_20410 [Rhodonellum psychrophilum GCM71 = DSM 17998]SDZ23560.1 two component transcriptional regulator, LytTR family [Rhodonellum ikkaensis]